MKTVIRIGEFILWGLVFLTIVACVTYLYITAIVESQQPVTSAPPTTQFVDVGSERIAYRELDNHSRTTVVFVGGLSAWSGTWERVMQALNNQNTVYNYLAIDLPPFGYSMPDTARGYFRNVQADRIEEVVKRLKLQNVILVAHSYGAGPAAEYVLRNTGEVKEFIIIDGVLNIDEIKQVPRGGLMRVDFLRNMLIGILAHNNPFAQSRLESFVYVPDNINRQLMDVYTRYFNTVHNTIRLSSWLKDYVNDPLQYASTDSAQYKRLAVPLRIIWGDKDSVTPIELTKVLTNSVPDSKLYTLKNIGHIPMIENHEVFDKALLEALSN